MQWSPPCATSSTRVSNCRERHAMTTQQLIDRLGRTRSTLASWQFGQLAVFFVVILFVLPILHHGVLVKTITTLFVINSLLVADSNSPHARELTVGRLVARDHRGRQQRVRRTAPERGADLRNEVRRHHVARSAIPVLRRDHSHPGVPHASHHARRNSRVGSRVRIDRHFLRPDLHPGAIDRPGEPACCPAALRRIPRTTRWR